MPGCFVHTKTVGPVESYSCPGTFRTPQSCSFLVHNQLCLFCFLANDLFIRITYTFSFIWFRWPVIAYIGSHLPYQSFVHSLDHNLCLGWCLNGYSLDRLAKRITVCYKRILEEQKGNDILLVGHGVVNRIILCRALGLDLSRIFSFHQDYGCLNIVDYFPDSTVIRLING